MPGKKMQVVVTWIVGMAAGAALLAWAGPVVAEDQGDEAARAAFTEGVKLYEKEQFAQALTAFKHAYDLKPNWKLLYNIGQCHAVLKDYGQAIDAFEQYLAEGGDEVSDDRRDGLLKELERLRQMVGTVMVEGPGGVDLYVDGEKRGATPMASGVLVSSGVVHEFRFERGGRVLGTQQERVRGGMTLTLKAPSGEGVPSAPAPAPAPAPAAAGPAPAEAAAEPAKEEPAAEAAPAEKKEEAGQGRKKVHPAFFWTGAGLTVLAAGGVLALDLAVGSKGESVSDSGELSSIEGMQAGGIACMAVAGAAGIATVVLAFFTDFKGEKEAGDKVALGAWTSGDGGGALLSGRF